MRWGPFAVWALLGCAVFGCERGEEAVDPVRAREARIEAAASVALETLPSFRAWLSSLEPRALFSGDELACPTRDAMPPMLVSTLLEEGGEDAEVWLRMSHPVFRVLHELRRLDANAGADPNWVARQRQLLLADFTDRYADFSRAEEVLVIEPSGVRWPGSLVDGQAGGRLSARVVLLERSSGAVRCRASMTVTSSEPACYTGPPAHEAIHLRLDLLARVEQAIGAELGLELAPKALLTCPP